MPKRIPITTARNVAEKHGLAQVLLIGWDGERAHIVTYGKTKADCASAAKAQDFWVGRIREFSFNENTSSAKQTEGDKSRDEPAPTTQTGDEDRIVHQNPSKEC